MLENVENVGWFAALITFFTGLFSKEHVWKFLNGLTGKGCRDRIRAIEANEAKRAVIYARYFSSMNTLKILLKNLVNDNDPNFSLVQEFVQSLPSEEEIKSLTDGSFREDTQGDTGD